MRKLSKAVRRALSILMALVMTATMADLSGVGVSVAKAEEGSPESISFAAEGIGEAYDIIGDKTNIGSVSDFWYRDSESGIYTAAIGDWFGSWMTEEEWMTLGEFAAKYNSLTADFKVSGLTCAEENVPYITTATIAYMENWDAEAIYSDISCVTNKLTNGTHEFTFSLSDLNIEKEYENYYVSGITFNLESPVDPTGFRINSLNAVGFTGTATYALFSGEGFNCDVEFTTGWWNEDISNPEYYANPGTYLSEDNTLTLKEFAEKYCEVTAEFKVPDNIGANSVKIKDLKICFSEKLNDENADNDSLYVDFSDTFINTGDNSVTASISDLFYDKKYENYYIDSVCLDLVSNAQQTVRLYDLNTLIPEKDSLYVTMNWNWDDNCLEDSFTSYDNITVNCGEWIYSIVFYYTKEVDGALISTPITAATLSDGALTLNSNMKIYYQEDETSTPAQCKNISINHWEFGMASDPIMNVDGSTNNVVSSFTFNKGGIYTVEYNDGIIDSSVKFISEVPEIALYATDGHLMTNADTFNRVDEANGVTAETITLKPQDESMEYSVFILDDYGYGSEGYCEDEKFLKVTDPSGNDITDKVHYTNFAELSGDIMTQSYTTEDVFDLDWDVTLTGNINFTLTEYAHRTMLILVRYKDEDGNYKLYQYEWIEPDDNLNLYPRETFVCNDDDNQEGFGGYIISEAEYCSGGIDWWSGKPIAVANGQSIKEVIEKLTQAIKDGNAENYGYIWISTGYIRNADDEYNGMENASQDQYLSSDIDGMADIKGILMESDTLEYDQRFDFDADLKSRIRTYIDSLDDGKLEGITINAPCYNIDSDESESVIFGIYDATNDSDDVLYMISAADNDKAFYVLEGSPEEGFSFPEEIQVVVPKSVDGSYETISYGGTTYTTWNWFGTPINFPKLHVDATNELFIIGDFIPVSDGEANIFMKLAEGTTTIINGETYTLGEDGKVHGVTRDGEKFTLEEGSIDTKSGSYDNWQVGEVDYEYKVLVDKLEVKSTVSVSEDSAVADASMNVDVDSLYDQITADGIMSDTDRANLEGGNNLTVESEISNLEEGTDLDTLEAESAEKNAESTEYVDIILDYYVGYGSDAEKTAITDTDSDITVSITLTGEQYRNDTDPDHYTIARDHEGVVEYITPESVTATEDGVIVTFKSNKFSAYAIMFGACINGHTDEDNDGVCDDCGLVVCKSVGLAVGDNISMIFRYELPASITDNKSSWKLVFTIDGTSKDVALSSAATTVADGKTYYDFYCEVPAKAMGDYITVDFTDGNTHSEMSCSVKQYCDVILNSKTTSGESESYKYSEDNRNFIKSLIQYGAANQNLLGYKTDNPVNSNVAAPDAVALSGDYKAVTEGAIAGASYYESSICLDNKTSMRMYFYLPKSADNYTVTLNGAAATATKSENYYFVETSSYYANGMNRKAVVKITDNQTGESLTVTQSLLSYIQLELETENQDDKLKTVCQRLFELYYYASKL